MACILVVEDEGAIRELIVEVLRDEGFQIVEAPSADAAVDLLKLTSLRLIVTDINLPGLRDGVDLAVEAREACPGIPVIFISGRPLKLAEASKVLDDPAAFLLKPFKFEALIQDVERLAGMSGGGRG